MGRSGLYFNCLFASREDLVDIIILVTLILLIAAVGFGLFLFFRFLGYNRQSDNRTSPEVLEERISTLQSEVARITEEKNLLQQERDQLNLQVKDLEHKVSGLEKDLALAVNQMETEREQSREKLKVLTNAREELANQFQVLASKILDEKSKALNEASKNSLGELLSPFRMKLSEFQRSIQENYVNEGKERHSLRNEVQKLMEMNAALSREASNLTNALKGDNKTQGNWGEMILEKILEGSGLRRGEEYTVQESHSREDGSRVQPDVVLHLPENRHMIIDSKVSLNSYDEYVNSEGETIKSEALKNHLFSIRNHMKGLSSKEYEKLYGEQSPDFVIMFIPIESAFMLAISEDRRLWEDAWKSNILLVSPSTLLFVLRIVMQLWRQEHRSKNALEISRKGAALYEKLAGFVKDFDDIGVRMEQARKSFESAKGKLHTGRGNVIRQAEQLKELGITTNKQISEEYLELSQ